MAIDQQLLEHFQALPVHAPRQYSRLGLDPRLAKKFARSPDISPEVKQALLQYIVTSSWRPKERAVYGACLDGYTEVSSISSVTGLTEAEVNTTLNKLASKGAIRRV